jgi:hypothetical protein
MRIPTTLVLALVIALVVGVSLTVWRGCSSHRKGPALTAEQQDLVNDMVALYRLRITRISDPEAAVAMLDSLHLALGPADVERALDALAVDPRRSTLVLQAIQDSLQALRGELFPPTQGTTPRTAEGAQSRTDEH